MTLKDHQQDSTALSAEGSAEMTKLGITWKSIDYFYLGKYRYTDLKDAMAQAKRQQAPGS